MTLLVKTVIVIWDKEARDVAVAALTANNKGFAEFSTFTTFEDIDETLCGPEYNSDLVNSNGLNDNVVKFPPRERDVL